MMIDTHTHILPGVDDGIQTAQDAIQTLRDMEKSGVGVVVATPHVSTYRDLLPERAFLEEQLEVLRQNAKAAGLNIELRIGAEIDECDRLEELIGSVPGLGGGKAVLLDFLNRPVDIEELAYEFSLTETTLIVAHPERYTDITLDAWQRARQYGAKLQLTAKHLFGGGRKGHVKRARKLLKADLADLVASDLHRAEQADDMTKAYRYVRRRKGEAGAERLFRTNPAALLG